MVMWRYMADRRLTLKEARAPKDAKLCLCEAPEWARIAERMGAPNYQWVPCGYICVGCNTIIIGVP